MELQLLNNFCHSMPGRLDVPCVTSSRSVDRVFDAGGVLWGLYDLARSRQIAN